MRCLFFFHWWWCDNIHNVSTHEAELPPPAAKIEEKDYPNKRPGKRKKADLEIENAGTEVKVIKET